MKPGKVIAWRNIWITYRNARQYGYKKGMRLLVGKIDGSIACVASKLYLALQGDKLFIACWLTQNVTESQKLRGDSTLLERCETTPVGLGIHKYVTWSTCSDCELDFVVVRDSLACSTIPISWFYFYRCIFFPIESTITWYRIFILPTAPIG